MSPTLPIRIRAMLLPDSTPVIQTFMPYVAILGSLGYVAFYFIERGMGYADWWPLRLTCILFPLGILLFPRGKPLRWWHLLYWELTGWLLLPMAQSFLFFLNRPDSYWSNSITNMGLFLGFLTRPLRFPVHLATGSAAAIGLYTFLHGTPEPQVLMTFVGLLATSCITGALALVVQGGYSSFHRRGLELTDAKARAHEARKREEEIRAALAEVSRRENVISRFVRPSLTAELAQGRDPTRFEPVEKELAVLFCDIREFTHLTEVLGPREKLALLNHYFSLMTHPMVECGGEVDKIMGDCVMGVFPDGASAVRAADGMQRQLQEFNSRMVAEGRPIIRNGVGIAKGTVLLGNFGSYEKLDRTVIGEPVNIASRLESKTKMYNLEVVVTEDVVRDLGPTPAHCRWIDVVRVKGSSRRLRIYEIYSHQSQEVRRYKDATREMLEKALTIYFRKGFRDARRLFSAMLEEVPRHQHVPAELMDNILPYYLDRCDAWLKDGEGAWERIQAWEGVHAFLDK